MWSRRLSGIAILLATTLPFGCLQPTFAETASASNPVASNTAPGSDKAPQTLEDVRAKRKVVRKELMQSSLRGIRGLGYGVVHSENSAELEKVMAKRLKQLDIPLHPFETLKPGVKPVDALLEVKVMSVPTAQYVQLALFQWATLIRDNKTEVRAITYHDAALTAPEDLNKTVDELTNQFVIDVLKANDEKQIVAKDKVPAHKKRVVR